MKPVSHRVAKRVARDVYDALKAVSSSVNHYINLTIIDFVAVAQQLQRLGHTPIDFHKCRPSERRDAIELIAAARLDARDYILRDGGNFGQDLDDNWRSVVEIVRRFHRNDHAVKRLVLFQFFTATNTITVDLNHFANRLRPRRR